MPRPSSSPYFFAKCNQGKSKDRYSLHIRDANMKRGYKQIIFHASKREAGVKAKELYEKYIRSNVSNEEKKGRDGSPDTVDKACGIFMKRRAAGRKAVCQPHSIKQVTSRFKNHFMPFFRNRKLGDVTVEDVTAYRNSLQGKGLSEKTVRYCVDEAKEFFAYCVEVEWLSHTPFDSTFKMARPKPKKIRVPGSIDDYRLMLQKGWKNPVNHAVAMICFFTGMRISEIRALKKDDFEPYYNHPEYSEDCVIIHIRHSLTNENVEKAPKNGRERTTVIPRWVYEFIAPAFSLSRTSLCFSNTAGKTPLSIDKNLKNFRNELANAIGSTAEEIRASGIDFHSMRAMFNSAMTGTLSSDIRRGILGWTSENVALEHYFRVLPIHYQKILDAQRTLFDEDSVRWFRSNNILDLSNEYKTIKTRR